MDTNTNLISECEQKIVDEASTSVTYVGSTSVGIPKSSGAWQIKKIEVSGTITTVSYPVFNGKPSAEYKFVWDNRASYTYSLS